ncbi:hypothetical protein PILCRDRAFT_603560 [Piloderma croceum F 1598]|uniref:Glycoside hydrolase family 16 protein n=1 Tax=Piloderma croceum (strain F 1598) TaxID=765440 RepID=A0A0C3FDX6_PILCF|nr:hypothetical protein PILCRDRAFT_603560 [Piloderma croceum F 1598]
MIGLKTTEFPAEMFIDYVGVYQRKGQTNIGFRITPLQNHIQNQLDTYNNPNLTKWNNPVDFTTAAVRKTPIYYNLHWHGGNHEHSAIIYGPPQLVPYVIFINGRHPTLTPSIYPRTPSFGTIPFHGRC